MLKPIKIKEIIDVGFLDTYDISVKDNHNFFLKNGILSHNSEDLLCIGEMPSQADREAACGQLIKDKRMGRSIMRAIATLPIHQLVVIARGQSARIIKRIALPRTRYWKEGQGNFYTIWQKEQDTWRNADNDKDMVEQAYEESRKKLVLEKFKEEEDIFESDEGESEEDGPIEEGNSEDEEDSIESKPVEPRISIPKKPKEVKKEILPSEVLREKIERILRRPKVA